MAMSDIKAEKVVELNGYKIHLWVETVAPYVKLYKSNKVTPLLITFHVTFNHGDGEDFHYIYNKGQNEHLNVFVYPQTSWIEGFETLSNFSQTLYKVVTKFVKDFLESYDPGKEWTCLWDKTGRIRYFVKKKEEGEADDT